MSPLRRPPRHDGWNQLCDGVKPRAVRHKYHGRDRLRWSADRTDPGNCRGGRERGQAGPGRSHHAGVSHRVFVTSRRVRFVESEYAVPRESLGYVLAELRREVPRRADPVMFPVEVRVAAAELTYYRLMTHIAELNRDKRAARSPG